MITLYTIDCPMCRVLEKKLNEKNVKFLTKNDKKELIKLGFYNLPVLEVEEGQFMNFKEAMNWIEETYNGKV